jgi:hypothetical protein
MLCIIFTKKKLLAGIKTDHSHLFEIDGKTHINFEGRASYEVLERNLSKIIDAYKNIARENNLNLDEPIPTSLAFPVEVKEYEKEGAIRVVKDDDQLSFVLGENLVVSFVSGLKDQEKISGDNYLVLESLGDYTNLCYHIKNTDVEPKGEVKEIGREALFYDEDFNFFPFKSFGNSTGNANLLNELLTEFSSAGLSIDVKGQTDLALQLMAPNDDYRFTFSKVTDLVNIEAEIKLSEEKYYNLFTINKEKLNDKLGKDVIESKGIENVVLLGDFLKNKALQIYFEEDLKLKGKLFSLGQKMNLEEYNTIIDGLAYRTMEVLEAERIKEEELERIRQEEERRRKEEEERRRLEEEKRNKIANELKVKEDRESLLKEIRENCVDPEKKEEYEEMYVARGERLQIPDVVIKWNINEVLTAIELKKEEETLKKPEDEPVVEEEVESEAAVEEVEAVEETIEEEEVEEEEVAEEVKEKEKPEIVADHSVNGEGGQRQPELKPEPELVAVGAQTEAKEQLQPVAQLSPEVQEKEVAIDETFPEPETQEEEKEEEKEEKPVKRLVKTKDNKEHTGIKNWKKEVKEAKMSLNDLFLIKGALKDPEFSTKKVTLYADHEPKVVKVLTAKEVNNPDKIDRFIKLYEKELSYYKEMSELGVAKEGLYYFRDFIERTTLKDYVNKIGLDKKLSIEELTSSELKFILQVFKEVRELSVPHANLSEDNILVVSKRKWNLQKNVEIKFIGFTADNTDEKGMIEETHNIFSRLMGKDFYVDFREKFQL